MKILQLRQSQVPNIPFPFYRGLHIPGIEASLVKETENYLIVPTNIAVAENNDMDTIHNMFLQLAKFKGFTHLMLMYV